MEPIVTTLLVILALVVFIGLIIILWVLLSGGSSQLPGPITGLVSKYNSNFTISNTWNPAVRATSYNWEFINNGSTVRSGSTTTTSVTFEAQNSGNFTFTVAGVNAVGKGPTASTSVTVPATGTTVQSATACQPGTNQLRVIVTFTPSAATSVLMSINTGSGPSYSATTLTPTGPSNDPNIQWTGSFTNLPTNYLVNGTSYNIRIVGITNGTSGTPYTLQYTGNTANTCSGSGVPAAPTNVQVTTIVSSSGPSYDQATWNTSALASSYSWSVTDPSTGTVQNSGVTSGTSASFPILPKPQYSFNVRAINSAGASPVTSILFSP